MLKEKRFLSKYKLENSIKKLLLDKIIEILFSKEEIIFSYIYGSFIKEESFRDIDIAIYVKEDKGFIFESFLSMELTEAVELPVETKILNSAPVSFQINVLKEGKLLFSRDEEERTNFIENVSRRYREYAHFRNIFLGIEGK
ncbi:MAG: nucleotidyltransferase domain-containing protein [Candidatus Aminicenantia bacterium]